MGQKNSKKNILKGLQTHGNFEIGALAHELGRNRKAKNEYIKEINLTDYWKAHYNLGIIFLNQCKYREALKHFSVVIKKRPKMCDAYNYRGIILTQLRDYNKAIQSFKKACNLNKNKKDPLYLVNLAVAYDEAGQTQRAIAKYRQVLKLAPNHFQTLKNFGDLLIVEEISVNEGMRYLKRAQRKEKKDPQILACLALGYQKQGREKQAQMYGKKAKQIAPKDKLVAEQLRWVKKIVEKEKKDLKGK